MDIRRKLKLFLNLTLTAAVFVYFILILILLLNPHISITGVGEFFLLYRPLLTYYGPLWFIVVGLIFFIIQFFSEKKYPIGLFSPPTVTYFLAFTILVMSVILYLNYDYYSTFLAHNIRAKYIKVLFTFMLLIIIGIVFVFLKKRMRKWFQAIFIVVLIFHIINSYYSVTSIGRITMQDNRLNIFPRKLSPPPKIDPGVETADQVNSEIPPPEIPQRKIRIVIMDGLSLKLLHSLSSGEKLLNFRLLMSNGVNGRITTFKPNFDFSLMNSALTGLRPSEFIFHSDKRFKFTGLPYEFDIFPRYIFFRNSSILGITTFYKKSNVDVIDNIAKYYENNDFATARMLNPIYIPRYAPGALSRNSSFIIRFFDIVDSSDTKFDIVKKSFFLDDYLKNTIPNLKDSNMYYTVIQFPGLGIISKYFYQYYDPDQLFSRISEADIKKYGLIIGKYYEYYDSIIGHLMTTTGDNELLVILSFFEYEPLPVWRRILANLSGENDIYVYKPLDCRGTILLYEKNAVKKDYPIPNISILDIFPTLIYYSGFQLSKNLQGDVIKEIFSEEFQLNNPIDINTITSKEVIIKND